MKIASKINPEFIKAIPDQGVFFLEIPLKNYHVSKIDPVKNFICLTKKTAFIEITCIECTMLNKDFFVKAAPNITTKN